MTERFEVRLTRQARKDLDNLQGPWREKAVRHLLKLEENREDGELLSGDLYPSYALKFSLPGGEFRAAYVFLRSKKVFLIYLIGPRENFYELASRRMRALRRNKEI